MLKNWKFILPVFLLILLLVFRDVAAININQFIIFAIMFISVALLPYHYGLFYTSFACGIVSGINAYFLICAYVILLFKSRRLPTRLQILPLVLLLLVEFIDNAFNGSSISVGEYLLFGSYLAIFFYYIFLNESPAIYRGIIVSFLIGLAVTLTLVSVGVIKNPQLLLMDEAIERGRMGFSGDLASTHFALNANNIAYFSITLLAFLLLGSKTLGLNRVMYFFLIIIAVLSGLLSQSRTWVIVLGISLILIMLLSNFKQKLTIMFAFTLILLIVLYFSGDLMDVILSGLKVRFETEDIGTAGGRTDIFTRYNRFMMDNPRYIFTGTGTLNYREVANVANSCHNATQQLFVCYGLFGIILYSVIFRKTLLLRSRGITYANYIAAIVPVMFIQSIQFLSPHYLMLPVAMSALVLRIPKHE